MVPCGRTPPFVMANGSISIVNVLDSVRKFEVGSGLPRSVIVMPAVKLPAAPGVPVTAPAVLMLSPGGKFVADQEYEPLPPEPENANT